MIVSFFFSQEDDGSGNLIYVVAGVFLHFREGYVSADGLASSPSVGIEFDQGIALDDFIALAGDIDVNNIALKNPAGLKAILGEGSLQYEKGVSVTEAPVASDVDVFAEYGDAVAVGGEYNITAFLENLRDSGYVFDNDNDSLTVSFSGLPANGAFMRKVDDGSGNITYEAVTLTDFDLTAVPQDIVYVHDGGTATTDTITISYSDGTYITQSVVTLTIDQPVDQKATFALGAESGSLAEDADTTDATVLTAITITDNGLGTNTLSIASAVDADGGDASSLFDIVGGELVLVAGASIDHAMSSSYTITISLDSTGEGTAPADQTFRLNIDDVDEAPSAINATKADNAKYADGLPQDFYYTANGLNDPILVAEAGIPTPPAGVTYDWALSAQFNDGSDVRDQFTYDAATGQVHFIGSSLGQGLATGDHVLTLTFTATGSDGSVSTHGLDYVVKVGDLPSAKFISTTIPLVEDQTSTNNLSTYFANVDPDLNANAQFYIDDVLIDWMQYEHQPGSNPHIFNVTPPNDYVGLHNVVAKVTNDIGHSYIEFSIQVQNTPDRPIVKDDAPDEVLVEAGVLFSLDLMTIFDDDDLHFDEDNEGNYVESLSYALNDDAPTWLSTNDETSILSGTPSAADLVDDIEITLTVTDNSGRTRSHNLTITDEINQGNEEFLTLPTNITLGTTDQNTIDKSAETDAQLIQGDDGNDTITASNSGDVIVGGYGKDTIHLGDGADVIIHRFLSSNDSNDDQASNLFTNRDGGDVINNFEVKEDKLFFIDERSGDTSLSSVEDLFTYENVKHGVQIELISGEGGFAGVVLKFGQDGTFDGTATGDDAGGALQINFKESIPTFGHSFYNFDFDTLTLRVLDEHKVEFVQQLFGDENIDVSNLADLTADYSITIL